MRSAGIKLGIFTLFTIFITFWLASIIGNISPLKDTYSIQAEFNDATGILVGDQVKIAGVDIGKVSSFSVSNGVALVTMQINSEVALPANLEVEMKFRNLLGQRVVNLLRPEPPSAEFLSDGDVVPIERTRPALDIGVVFNNLRPLITTTNPEEINTVARAVLDIFKGREGDFAQTLDNLGDISKALAGKDQRLSRLVTDLNDLTAVLNNESSSIQTGFSEFTSFIEKLATITPTIETVVDQLEAASSKFGRILAKNRSNIDQELADLSALLGVVNDNLGPLDTVAKNLKEVILATARSQSYGKWWNLYVVNFCLEGAPSFGGCSL